VLVFRLFLSRTCLIFVQLIKCMAVLLLTIFLEGPLNACGIGKDSICFIMDLSNLYVFFQLTLSTKIYQFFSLKIKTCFILMPDHRGDCLQT
jgi:hypothetical protein